MEKIAESSTPKPAEKTVEMEKVVDDAIRKMENAPDTLNASMMEVIGDPLPVEYE